MGGHEVDNQDIDQREYYLKIKDKIVEYSELMQFPLALSGPPNNIEYFWRNSIKRFNLQLKFETHRKQKFAIVKRLSARKIFSN